MWNDLLSALALILVIEGVMPFLSPGTLRRSMQQLAQLPDRVLRVIGLSSMVGGVLLLYIVRQF
jgi:uncharacterized protein YjeT (DUF2065 family)